MIKHLLIIFFLCLILVIVWFKDGYIMGTAEAVLPFYNLERYYYLSEYAWTFHPGLGNIAGTTVAGKPFYFLLSILQNNGVPGFILQASVFLLVLFLASLGSYLLMKELFPKIPPKYYLYSSLIYLFNPVSLVNIWNRFLLNFMVFYAFLPLGVFVYLKGIREKKYFYSLIFSLISLLFSYALSSMAFIMLLWIILAIFTIFYLLISKNWQERFFYLKYSFLTLLIFLITNLWFLSQLFNYTSPGSFKTDISTFHPQQVNITTLESLSNIMGNLTDLFRLNNASFLNNLQLDWVKIYGSLPVVFLTFTIAAIALFGILKGRKEKSVMLLAFVFFTALFLSKGSNPPYGFLYEEVFKLVPPLQAFRNPIEKFSFLLILVFAPLLSIGLFYLSKTISEKITTILLLAFIGVCAFPLFSGLVFTSNTPPNNNPEIGFKVKVPDYYGQANNYFESQGNNYRVIGFPIADEGISYLWEKGYQGADLPSTLFSVPVVFFNTAVPYYYDLVKEIEPALFTHDDFTKTANFLNARFIFIRDDVDFKFRNLTDPTIIDRNLKERERKGELKKVADFGKLHIWENTNWKDLTFYSSTSIVASQSASLLDLDNINQDQVLVENSNILSLSGKPPKISYQKINPTFYKVKITDAKNSFALIFSETFNPGWEASIQNEKVNNHFRANVYANGWLLNKPGDYEVDIKFKPQDWLNAAEKVSIASSALVILILTAMLIKNKRK